MARIAGVDIPNEKRVEIGLTYIYGIGRVRSNKILAATGINPDTPPVHSSRHILPPVYLHKNSAEW